MLQAGTRSLIIGLDPILDLGLGLGLGPDLSLGLSLGLGVKL